MVYSRGLRALKDLDLYIDDSGGGGRSKALEEDRMRWQNIILYTDPPLSLINFANARVIVCVRKRIDSSKLVLPEGCCGNQDKSRSLSVVYGYA